jgi:hypothetical protein
MIYFVICNNLDGDNYYYGVVEAINSDQALLIYKSIKGNYHDDDECLDAIPFNSLNITTQSVLREQFGIGGFYV